MTADILIASKVEKGGWMNDLIGWLKALLGQNLPTLVRRMPAETATPQ